MSSPSDSKTYVPPGQFKGHKASQPGLESHGFGTCVGVVVTGEPHEGGKTRFLFHISLGQTWQDIRKPWYEFVEDIEKSRVSQKKGYIFTVDTSLNLDPDCKHDLDMQKEADVLKPTYGEIDRKLQYLVGSGNVARDTHSFARPGHMEVDTNNRVRANGVLM